jgi:electron transport complex protein RnfE
MNKKNEYLKILTKGLWQESPTFYQILGMCPTLAVTVSVTNGIAMGLATSFVLIFSAVFASLIKNLVPSEVRIPVYAVLIATFVTVADLFLKAFFPDLSKALGPYVPLIVVNCIIMGRIEAFSTKNGIFESFLDSLGMGLGFTCALIVIGAIRELLGNGQILGIPIISSFYNPMLIMILPAGAFLTLGFLIALYKFINKNY